MQIPAKPMSKLPELLRAMADMIEYDLEHPDDHTVSLDPEDNVPDDLLDLEDDHGPSPL
jgi:hypothetical protein